MSVAMVMDALQESMTHNWVELSFLVCFVLGAAFLRLDGLFARGRHASKKTMVNEPAPAPKPFDSGLKKLVEAEGASEAILAAWKRGRLRAPTPPELLKHVVQALLELEPDGLVLQLIDHVRKHHSHMLHARTAMTALDVLARAGSVPLMEELHEAFRRDLGLHPTLQTYEVLLGGYATAGDERKVNQVVSELTACRLRLSARSLSLMIKGYLKNGMVNQVIQQFRAMVGQGLQVPPFAVTQLCRIGCDAGCAAEVFDQTMDLVQLPPDAVARILEDCCKRSNFELAKRVEEAAWVNGVELLTASYDALMKLYTAAGDMRALALFEQMRAQGVHISEGLCVGLLSRCAESKLLRFAEEIVKFERSRGGMSIALYSALMKVYAHGGMYDKACDLYDDLLRDGLEPDSVMYGCLMKFAVECGRTWLSQQLSERAPSLDLQNYMSLIRAAGRHKDVDKAFAILQRLETSGMHVDAAAYNCVLDVCVVADQMDRARRLIAEMRKAGQVDTITYNIFLKGFCKVGDIAGAKELLVEMSQHGFEPNDISYNCLLNASVCHGKPDFEQAWEIIEMMQRNGVAVDNFTISIMMKALKSGKNSREFAKTLALMDRCGLKVCSDEVLLNSVIETCTRVGEFERVERILKEVALSNLRPSVHTYGSLIKACGALKRLEQCWVYWRQMEERGGEPNEVVLGCMLDALVCNAEVEEAVLLLDRMKGRVNPNSVMYSTVIKGFANSRQPERAMEMWRQMREGGCKMNTVVYNAVIDAQARMGAMAEVSELVKAMEADGITPDSITLSTIAKGYCTSGELDKAFEVLHDMQKNNLAKDSVVYNTILDGCTRLCRWDMADGLLKDMERLRIVPTNFTLGITVKMYGRRRQLNKAFEAMEAMPARYGFAPNPQVYTCLMCACINNLDFNGATWAFQELKRAGPGPDGKAFGVLIGGFVRNGVLDKAIELIEEAYGLKTGPGLCKLPPGQVIMTENLERLMHELAKRGHGDELAVPLLNRLRAARAPVSSRLYSIAMGHQQLEGGRQQQQQRQPQQHHHRGQQLRQRRDSRQ